MRRREKGFFKEGVAALLFLSLFWGPAGWARQGFSIGMGPVGNIYLIDTTPVMDPGIGGFMFFQYRFQEHVAFETTFLMTTQNGDTDGSGANDDTGILLLGMPVFDVKFFLGRDDPKWDPYIATGLGIYWMTEGRLGNSTGGTGLGAQLGLGFDYYISDFLSLGFEGVFRSIALITSLGTPSSSISVFPYSLMANVAFHF